MEFTLVWLFGRRKSGRKFPFSFASNVCANATMEPSSSSFLENRVFDQRLVKENLVDKWNLYGDIYKTRSDYRQFLDSYVIYLNFFPFIEIENEIIWWIGALIQLPGTCVCVYFGLFVVHLVHFVHCNGQTICSIHDKYGGMRVNTYGTSIKPNDGFVCDNPNTMCMQRYKLWWTCNGAPLNSCRIENDFYFSRNSMRNFV